MLFLELSNEPIYDSSIEILAAQKGIPGCGDYFKYTLNSYF